MCGTQIRESGVRIRGVSNKLPKNASLLRSPRCSQSSPTPPSFQPNPNPNPFLFFSAPPHAHTVGSSLSSRSTQALPDHHLTVNLRPWQLALKRLDDLIHGIIVQKSTPDWLPFVPGQFLFLGPTQTHGPRFGYQTRLSTQP